MSRSIVRRVAAGLTKPFAIVARFARSAFTRHPRLVHFALLGTLVAFVALDMRKQRPAPPSLEAAKSDSTPAAATPADETKTARAQEPAQDAPARSAPTSPPASTVAEPPSGPPRTAAVPSFQDARPLAAAAPVVAAPVETKPAAPPSFRDTRPVAAPSFRDQRAVAPPEPAPAAPPATAVAAQPPAPSSAAPASAQNAATTPSGAERLPTLVAVPPAALKVDAGACSDPTVQTEALEGGRMRITVAAPCRAGEAVQISYGGAEIIRRLDARGGLDYVLDCFAGAGAPADLRFADGARKSLPIVARDLDAVSKIAVIWRAPVNLDLHIFEYAARADEPGHIWAKAASSLEAARARSATDKRGHGYLSATDSEASLGDKVEVYTFLHSDEQTGGAISLALDYETRGELPSGATCGQGALAEIDFQVSMRPRGGQTTRQSGVLTRVECGQRIAQEARLNQAALPGLRIRR